MSDSLKDRRSTYGCLLANGDFCFRVLHFLRCPQSDGQVLEFFLIQDIGTHASRLWKTPGVRIDIFGGPTNFYEEEGPQGRQHG